MKPVCLRCGSKRPSLCQACWSQISSRYDRRVKELLQDVERLSRMLPGQLPPLSDPADGSHVEDDG
jgi:hypothetical protein